MRAWSSPIELRFQANLTARALPSFLRDRGDSSEWVVILDRRRGWRLSLALRIAGIGEAGGDLADKHWSHTPRRP